MATCAICFGNPCICNLNAASTGNSPPLAPMGVPTYQPTRLDYFSGLAMQGLLASPLTDMEDAKGIPPAISRASIMHAKELIKQLEEEKC